MRDGDLVKMLVKAMVEAERRTTGRTLDDDGNVVNHCEWCIEEWEQLDTPQHMGHCPFHVLDVHGLRDVLREEEA